MTVEGAWGQQFEPEAWVTSQTTPNGAQSYAKTQLADNKSRYSTLLIEAITFGIENTQELSHLTVNKEGQVIGRTPTTVGLGIRLLATLGLDGRRGGERTLYA